MTELATQAPSLEDVITADELSEFLGVSKRSLSSWRGLPTIRIGARRFYLKQSVATWLAKREEG